MKKEMKLMEKEKVNKMFTMENNIIEMHYIGEGDFNTSIFKCIETGTIYKSESIQDLNGDTDRITLHTCGNNMDGELGYPINSNKDKTIIFKDIPKFPNRDERFNYMFLGRLQSDCEYFLHYGNRREAVLYYRNITEHINEMVKLWNSFDDDAKPEWLTMDQIEEYKTSMEALKDVPFWNPD